MLKTNLGDIFNGEEILKEEFYNYHALIKDMARNVKAYNAGTCTERLVTFLP